jgi:predicted permease
MATRKNLAAGIPESEARRRARVRFGPKALIEDQCRDARGIGFIETLRQDIRYALRSFRRAPTFAITVIATIALGLGANAAVFTLFNAYLLRPLEVRDPYSLYGFTWRTQNGRFHSFTRAEYEQLKRDNHVFSEMFASRKQLIARIEGRPAYGKLVTEEYFRVLGVEAALGRTLQPEDARDPGREAVVVLSHAFWLSQYGGDPHIVGTTLGVRGRSCEIVGVLREGFAGLDLLPHDFWAPLALAPQIDDGPSPLEIIGRLRPDVSPKSAEASLLGWARAITSDRGEAERAMSVLFESRATSIPRSPLTLALFSPIVVAFALVMLIACANVANMMIARALARQREIGIRLSLGAGRLRVVRQLLTESLLLAVPAAVAAFIISQWTVDVGVRALMAAMPAEYAGYMRLATFSPDVRVFAFMVGAAVVSALLFGLAPALEATRPSLVRAARGEFMYDLPQRRPRNGLVVIQIMTSACLLICAVILLRSANRFANIDTGLRTRDVVEIGIREPSRERVLQVLESLPFRQVGAVSSVPLDAAAPRITVAVEGDSRLVNTAYRFATPEFFAVFDIPMVAGRPFSAEESASGAPIAIVSATAARRLWPTRNPIGQFLRIHDEQSRMKSGVAGEAPRDRGIGMLALVLTISGVYGLLSYVVKQRTKEIGIRMALGATIRNVTGLVLRQSFRLALLGLTLGVAMALGASTLFTKQMMMGRAFDGAAYLWGALIVFASCMLAACVPAARAARVNPANTLRND